MTAHGGGAAVLLHSFLTWTLAGDESLTSHPGCFIPGKEPRYSLDRKLGGLGRFLKREKSLAAGGIRTPDRGLVASRYTDYAIPAYHFSKRTETNQDEPQVYPVCGLALSPNATCNNKITFITREWGKVVGIATNLDGPGFRSRCEREIFAILHNVETGCGAHRASCLFQGIRRPAREVNL
jgi:hypothetical protein